MNQSNFTYNKLTLNATISSTFLNLTFTGKERDEETGYGYFGARYMDHELMTMWLSVDPMADKYPSLSPNNYCGWNPVKLVDLDGCKFDTTGTFSNDEQRQAWNNAIAELCKDEVCKKRYQQLQQSKTVYKIVLISDGKSGFISNHVSNGDNTLYWDPSASIKCENGTVLSPFLVLDHEFGHLERADNVYRLRRSMEDLYKKFKALGTNENKEKYLTALKKYNAAYNSWVNDLKEGSDTSYDTREERRNIKNVEWKTARRFGIIGADEKTRDSHNGTVVYTHN